MSFFIVPATEQRHITHCNCTNDYHLCPYECGNDGCPRCTEFRTAHEAFLEAMIAPEPVSEARFRSRHQGAVCGEIFPAPVGGMVGRFCIEPPGHRRSLHNNGEFGWR